MLLRRADQKGLLIWLVCSLGFGFLCVLGFGLNVALSALLSVNVSVFLVMLMDKVQATQEGRRLSERSLFLMTLFGGSIGMLCAIYLLRHKSRKWSFQVVVWLIILLQAIGIFFVFSEFFPAF